MRLEDLGWSQKGFQVVVTGSRERVVVDLVGDASLGTDRIGALVSGLHDEVVRKKTPIVVVDMRQLSFMNSSGFKCFVTWMCRINDLPETERYRVRVLSSPGMYWQSRTLQALQAFAVDVLEIAEA